MRKLAVAALGLTVLAAIVLADPGQWFTSGHVKARVHTLGQMTMIAIHYGIGADSPEETAESLEAEIHRQLRMTVVPRDLARYNVMVRTEPPKEGELFLLFRREGKRFGYAFGPRRERFDTIPPSLEVHLHGGGSVRYKRLASRVDELDIYWVNVVERKRS